jgi:hypothetical protein
MVLLKKDSNNAATPTSATAKTPAKGSYADIMARAKQAQETKAQTSVGIIKHQATNREKVSKVAERKRLEEEKIKAAKEKTAGRSGISNRPEKRRSVSPSKRDQPRVPKAPRPPLHAPVAAYKGTMGISAGKPRQTAAHKQNRYDEYLATDEEDNSDMEGYGEGEEDGYGSDQSSDMEAGAFDIDMEESRAARAAREEDAKEQALELQLKREKEERKKKLMGLASKRK